MTRKMQVWTMALGMQLLQPAHAIIRYVGSPQDPVMNQISRQCNGTDQSNYRKGRCADLMSCALGQMEAATQQGMSSGGAIASLVPTILALIGAQPLELVQLALLSPHRALATCCFGIGLPSSLFGDLRKPLLPAPDDHSTERPKEKQWILQLPSQEKSGLWYGRRSMVLAIVADVVVLALTGVMLWQNYIVNAEIMITWRCEYSYLLFAWPLACMVWLFLSMSLLWLLHSDMRIYWYERDTKLDHPDLELSLIALLHLPYTYRAGRQPTGRSMRTSYRRPVGDDDDEGAMLNDASAVESHPMTQLKGQQPDSSSAADSRSLDAPRIKVIITMPQEYGIRSWRWYEAMLGAGAVGIYLYATFVLASTVFMSGEMALQYAAVMAICLSFVRLVGGMF